MTRLRDKPAWIAGALRERRVLYVGSVDDDRDNRRKHRELHRCLHGHAGALVGVYRSGTEAARLREDGCEAVTGEAESLELGSCFEVVVAADNLEHLSNPGRFLDGVGRHLEPGGRLLVTTPNPVSLARLLESIVLRRPKANRAHTCWFTGQVLTELARRHGLELDQEVFIDEMYAYQWSPSTAGGSLWARRVLLLPVLASNYLACWLFPQLSETLGFAFVKCGNERQEPR